MIKIENDVTFGWESTIRGMRNPMNSWDKSDSGWVDFEDWDCGHGIPDGNGWAFVVGENDLALMKKLSKAGADHGKFLRMINVTFDITAPLYWWKEFDTYKVGTVANSCSTMHRIHAKEFTLDDFSHEHLISTMGTTFESVDLLEMTIEMLNKYRQKYLEAKTEPMDESKRSEVMKRYWWQMIQLLPSSYNQKRTVQLNYQVLKSMYHARKNHKLDEWREFCAWVETLPYAKELVLGDNT